MIYFVESGRLRFMGTVCGLFLLSACATIESAEKSIEVRATQRWDTLLSGDLAGAYEYLSPGIRSSVSSLQYQRSILSQQVQWTGARYIGSECEDSTCTVRISLDYAISRALPGVKSFKGTRTVKESWLLVDGTWYLVP